MLLAFHRARRLSLQHPGNAWDRSPSCLAERCLDIIHATSEVVRDAHALGLPQENGSGLSPPAAVRGAASEDMDGVPVFQLMCGEPGCCISLRLRPEQLGLEPVTLESVNMHEVRAVLSDNRAGSDHFHMGCHA